MDSDHLDQAQAEPVPGADDDFASVVVETVGALIVVLDRQGRIVRFNRACQETTGYSFEEVKGQRVWEFLLVPDEAASVQAVFAELKEGLGSNVHDNHWVTKDGQLRLIRWSNTAIVNETGAPKYVLGTGIDVTEQQQASESLAAIVKASPLGIIALDTEGRITMWNPAAERIYGWSAEEALGQLNPAIPEERHAESTRLWKRVLLGGENLTGVELTRRKRDGSWVDINLSAAPLRDPQGRIAGVMSLSADITQRKQIEADLRSLLHLHETLIATIPSCILVLDDDLRVVMANCRCWADAGVDPAVMRGRSLDEVLPDCLVAVPGLRDRVQAIASTGAEDGLLGVTYTTAGEAGCANIHICGLAETGGGGEGKARVLLVMDDITKQRALEEQLQQVARLESVGQLAGGVAHDFNNILTGVSGYAQLLLRQLEQDEGVSRDLRQIVGLSDRAARLTGQLLAFSRRQTLEPAVVDLNELIEDTLRMLRRLIGQDIDLQSIPGADLGNVRVDRGQIEQVLVNLAVNARDAMPEGGTLAIETSKVDLDQTYADAHVGVTPGPYVLMTVSDTGHGMDEETRRRSFEPFFTTKDVRKGTGLGLATVYGIVKQHGGNIWVYGEPGKGTTFKVYLPRLGGEAAAVDQAPVQALSAKGSGTILVVEDEPDVLSVASRVLGEAGYTVFTATNPLEAEALLAQYTGELSLLVTDVVMPGGSGPELHERLSARRPSLKVLYMSGYTEHGVVRRGILTPGNPFIQKPFTPAALAGKVRGGMRKEGRSLFSQEKPTDSGFSWEKRLRPSFRSYLGVGAMTRG